MSKKIKVEVLRTFRNKYSKSLHKAGDLLDISEKRLEEINSAGYGQLVREVEEPQKEPELEEEQQEEQEQEEEQEEEEQQEEAGD